MPTRLPILDIVTGLFKNILKALKFWLHSTLVAVSWLAVVPLTACRIYRCLFAGSVSSLLTLPLDMLSTDNIVSDILQGGFVVLCSLAAFICLVWLREQILSGGGPEWLENLARQNNPNINVLNNNNLEGAQRRQEDEDDEIIANEEANGQVNQNNNRANLFQLLDDHLEPENPEQNNRQPGGAGVNDDNHWNPMEWDRAAEDLTWDRVQSPSIPDQN